MLSVYLERKERSCLFKPKRSKTALGFFVVFVFSLMTLYSCLTYRTKCQFLNVCFKMGPFSSVENECSCTMSFDFGSMTLGSSFMMCPSCTIVSFKKLTEILAGLLGFAQDIFL